ncbi:MAG: MAPEG family protein [Pseudomonadota bacterium]|nr:MAPEG family protein [Pseudomonadota bacterium]
MRVVHSLIQSTVNLVMLRFGVFALSWVVLLVMTIREALVIF